MPISCNAQRLLRCILMMLVSLSPVAVRADVDAYQFDNETDRLRYQSFIKELRCPKCQNQNLADSNSPISADLRRELRRLIEEGMTDREIVDYMVSRYGDFVLYNPRLQDNTLLLWFGPGILFLIGLVVLVWLLRRNQSPPAPALSSEDRRHLDELLAGQSAQDTNGERRK